MDDIEKLSERAVSRTMAALDNLFSAADKLQGVSGIFHINMRVMQNLLYGSALIIRSMRMTPDLLEAEIEEAQDGSNDAPNCSEDVLFVALLLTCLNDTSGEEALNRAYLWYRKIMGRDYTKYGASVFGEIGALKH